MVKCNDNVVEIVAATTAYLFLCPYVELTDAWSIAQSGGYGDLRNT